LASDVLSLNFNPSFYGIVNYRPLSGRLGFFPTLSGKRQKHVSALIVAVETECKAPGLKQPITIRLLEVKVFILLVSGICI
jgi:hypothetical protein